LSSRIKTIATLLLGITLVAILTACETRSPVKAQKRVFLDLSLEFLGEYQLPKTSFKNTQVGGLSALTYDRLSQRFYALSDDRDKARFYTLNPTLTTTAEGEVVLENMEVEDVTFLRDEKGATYAQGTVDPEGIAVSPQGTVFISSEGVASKGIAPFVKEFDLKTGKGKQSLRIPQRFLPNVPGKDSGEPRGVRDNLGFEGLTLADVGLAKTDPFRLFTATESSLAQDSSTEEEEPAIQPPVRLLHYQINPVGQPILVAEHLYLLDVAPSDVIYNGVTELMALNEAGYFLSLERTFGFSGHGAKIFQIAMGNATDTSNIASLKNNLSTIQPLRKKLILDLRELGIPLDNLEGMTFGPPLPDGSQSLILVSDDNFRKNQVTQFLLFKISFN